MNKPIIVFDLETTSVDIATGKVVQLAAQKFDREMQAISEMKCYLFNPGIPIPAEATEIHGITNEMVANEPVFEQRAKAIHEFFSGCDVAGHNVEGFDVPLLAEEFDRCGICWPEPGMEVYDTYYVFREKEPRDLTAALKFYCGEILEGAHKADADVTAAAKVLAGQIARYPEMEGFKGIREITEGKQKKVDLAGKIALDAEGKEIYTIGKGKGVRVVDDPGFGHWIMRQEWATSNTKRILTNLIGPDPGPQYKKRW